MTNQITDVANFFSTTLTADVGAGSDTFPVDSIGNLTSPCFIAINPDDPSKREVILCDGTFGASSFVTSDRATKGALEGSFSPGVPIAHLTGDPVSVTPLAQHIDDLNDRVGAHTHTSGDDGAVVAHADLSLLTADDHTLYIRKDGTRAFTGEVAGITPTASASLATKGYIDARMPTGSMTMYGGSSAPSGWLLADGTAVSRTTYAALYAVLGTTFGAGDGSTTFNLPDMETNFPVGAQTGGAYDLGDTGGAAFVNLSTSEMPSHTHTGPSHTHSGPSHTHSASPPNTSSDNHNHTATTGSGGSHAHSATGFANEGGGGSDNWDVGGLTKNKAARNVDSGGSHTHSLTTTSDSHSHTIASFTTGSGGTGNTGSGGTGATGSAGSGSAHENRPPFLALNFIIKT